MPIEITKADPDTPAIAALIATHIAYGEAAYPSESNHHLTPDAHVAQDVHLFAAWDGPTCLGMIGLQMMAQHSAEVKSMHVLAEGRNRGTGTALLGHLIAFARTQDIKTLYLETGSRDASRAARNLYARAGFGFCAPFGDYVLDPESVFMSLSI